jgi:hypothetical protein
MPYNIGVANLLGTWCSTWLWSDPPAVCPGKLLGTIGRDPSVSKCNWLHVEIFWLFLYKLEVFEVYCFNSSKMMGNFPKVLNFNQLFLKLSGWSVTSGRFLPIHWSSSEEYVIILSILSRVPYLWRCFYTYYTPQWLVFTNYPTILHHIYQCPCMPNLLLAGDSWHSSKIIRADEKNAGII